MIFSSGDEQGAPTDAGRRPDGASAADSGRVIGPGACDPLSEESLIFRANFDQAPDGSKSYPVFRKGAPEATGSYDGAAEPNFERDVGPCGGGWRFDTPSRARDQNANDTSHGLIDSLQESSMTIRSVVRTPSMFFNDETQIVLENDVLGLQEAEFGLYFLSDGTPGDLRFIMRMQADGAQVNGEGFHLCSLPLTPDTIYDIRIDLGGGDSASMSIRQWGGDVWLDPLELHSGQISFFGGTPLQCGVDIDNSAPITQGSLILPNKNLNSIYVGNNGGASTDVLGFHGVVADVQFYSPRLF